MKKVYIIFLTLIITLPILGQREKKYGDEVKRYGLTVTHGLVYEEPVAGDTLTSSVTGNGSVTFNPSGGVYETGTSVSVSANADFGWSFDSWGGDLSGSTNPETIIVSGNKSVSATFTLDTPVEPWDGDVWYIATDGRNVFGAGDTIIDPFLTLTFALSPSSGVSPGDSVYMKAGNYGKEKVYPSISGAAGQPIVVQGYKTTPGDQPKNDWDWDDAPDANEMPLFQHDRDLGRKAFRVFGYEYLTFNNIQIDNYSVAIQNRGGHNIYENIFVHDVGYADVDPGADSPESGILLEGNKRYISQLGAVTYDSDSCKLINCVVVNSSGAAIYVWSDYDSIDNCRVYCDGPSTEPYNEEATGYYISLLGSHNDVYNSLVQRDDQGGLTEEDQGYIEHTGHGIGVKGDWVYDLVGSTKVFSTEYNTIRNSTAIGFTGEAFYIAKASSKNNTVDSCKVLRGCNGFLLRDGASENVFSNCWADSMVERLFQATPGEGAFTINNFAENGENPFNNTYKNCLVTNSFKGIQMLVAFGATDDAVNNNDFLNCTFYNIDNFVGIDMTSSNIDFTNCIASGVTTKYFSLTKSDEISYTYSDFYNWSESVPSGSNNITGDPLFADPGANEDYTLQTGSPCINAGYPIPGIEYEGTAPDMGAFEKE